MIKYSVKMQLSGRVFRCFLACLIPAVVPWVLRLFPTGIGELNFLVSDMMILTVSIPMQILSFIAAVFVINPINVKLAAYFLTLNRNPEALPSPLSVCDCFTNSYGRLVKAMLLRDLELLVWGGAPLVIALLIPGAIETGEVSGYSVIRLTGGGLPWFALLSIALSTYRSLTLSMVPYLLAENPALSPREAIRQSKDLTRGRVLELLVLQLSFFGWLVLCSLTFFIAAIYTYPYIEATMAAYYIAFTTLPHPDSAEYYAA